MYKRPMFTVALNLNDRNKEDEFNDWYNRVHLPMMTNIPGIVAGNRYEAVNFKDGEAQYLATYQFVNMLAVGAVLKSPEFGAATEDLMKNWGTSMAPVEGLAEIYTGVGISMGKPPVLPLAMNVLKPEKEYAFSQWFANEYLDEIRGVAGIEEASLYHVMITKDPAQQARYLSLFTVESLEKYEAMVKTPAYQLLRNQVNEKIAEGIIKKAAGLGIVYINFEK